MFYSLVLGEKKKHKKRLKQYFHKAWEQNLSSSFLEGWFSINTFVQGAACKIQQVRKRRAAVVFTALLLHSMKVVGSIPARYLPWHCFQAKRRRAFAACNDKCVFICCACIVWELCVLGCGWLLLDKTMHGKNTPRTPGHGNGIFLFCILSPSYTKILKFPSRHIL